MRGAITPLIPVSPLILIFSERSEQFDVYLAELNRYCLHRFNFVL